MPKPIEALCRCTAMIDSLVAHYRAHRRYKPSRAAASRRFFECGNALDRPPPESPRSCHRAPPQRLAIANRPRSRELGSCEHHQPSGSLGKGNMGTLERHVCERGSLRAGIVSTCVLWLSFAAAFAGANLVDAPPVVALCAGDCDGLGAVTVDEVVTLVVIALGNESVEQCEVGDVSGDGAVTVDEILSALTLALDGCFAPDIGVCGNGIVDAGEQCDDGGACIGGPRAGSACTSAARCLYGGACLGGLDDLHACEGDHDCRGGTCRRCRPFGGDGCAANCSLEIDTAVDLVSGIIVPPGTGNGVTQIAFGTSGAALYGLASVQMPLVGSLILTTGRTVDNVMPVVIRAGAVVLDSIQVSTIACLCHRFPEVSTCGGTSAELDGSTSRDCTPGFEGGAVCPPDKPCAPVNGAGNVGSGFITCAAPPIEIETIQDCNGTPGEPPFPAMVSARSAAETAAVDIGNALITMSDALADVVGSCSGTAPAYGADGAFCTADDPIPARGRPILNLFGTNAAATILNPGDFEGDTNGPIGIEGAPFRCLSDGAVDVGAAGIASAFTVCELPAVHDVPIPTVLFFEPAPILPGASGQAPDPGPGDCCQCDDPDTCRAATSGTCGSCFPVFGAACGAEGRCARHTRTPTSTPPPAPTRPPPPTRTPPPTPTKTCRPAFVRIEPVEFAGPGSKAVVEVTLRGECVAAEMQNDIVFDNSVLSLTAAGCQINPAIGRFPKGPPPAITCDDSNIGACKTFTTTLQQCGSDPQPLGCPEEAGSDLSVLTQVILGTGTNANQIPAGVLYTCELELIDPGGLPTVLLNRRAYASDPRGASLATIGVDGVASSGSGAVP